jgi:hypothetical protein
MSLPARRALVPLSLILCLGLPLPAGAAGGVEDGAGLFGRSARIKADDAIEEIRHRTHRDLFIETVQKLPEAKVAEYQALQTEPDRARFFRALAQERAEAAGVNGVYVLLCRVTAAEEPRRGVRRFLPRALAESFATQVVGHAVVVWPESNDVYFPEEARQHLDRLFGSLKLTDHNHDKVLLQAVDFAGAELVANVRGAEAADTFHWTDAVLAAAVLLGAWAVLGALRARVAARQGTPGPVPGADQALAALFGVAGGLWLLEAYRARRQEQPQPAPVVQPAAAATEGGDAMHPDDLEALARGPGLWAAEDAEATTGHDLP